MTHFYTYLHTRTDTGAVFYVGKGKGLRAHSIHGRSRHWKNIVEKCDHTVIVLEDAFSDEQDAFATERYLIASLRAMGVPLCNLTDGGEGVSGITRSPETRAKQSAGRIEKKSNLGRKHTLEQKTKISAALMGHTTSTETRKKIGAAGIGRIKSPETLAKIGAASKLAWKNRRLKLTNGILESHKQCTSP